MTPEEKEELLPEQLWVFSKGLNKTLTINSKLKDVNVIEYKISSIAEYMINPNSIKVIKKLVGCQLVYKQPFISFFLIKLKKLFPNINDHSIANENLLENYDLHVPVLKNEFIEIHLTKILETLKPYSQNQKKLDKVNKKKLLNVIGMIDEVGTAQATLQLKGSISDKIEYIQNFLQKKVGITFSRAYLTNGLFEMSGFDFTKYNPADFYRLIKFFINGKSSFCVMDKDYQIKYWMDDPKLIYYLQIFEQCLTANPNFRQSFQLCLDGKAEPVKLFFNNKLNIDYDKVLLPKIYQQVFEKHHLGLKERYVITKYLGSAQLGISFHYILNKDLDKDKISTNILVLHNLKAIEPLKDDLPLLYNEISKMAFLSEEGKYYLLDFIKGIENEQ